MMRVDSTGDTDDSDEDYSNCKDDLDEDDSSYEDKEYDGECSDSEEGEDTTRKAPSIKIQTGDVTAIIF
eukprot:3682428-Ditylum_brightwellii.AAC.1